LPDVPIYWTNPHRNEFDVSIKSMKRVNDHYHITIEENVIRPAGGGQAGERGVLIVGNQSVDIIDTISDSGEVVMVSPKGGLEETSGKLRVDMDWRFSMMRNHTSEHLFVSMVQKRHEELSIGDLWIDGKQGTVELLNIELGLDEIFEIEEEVNRLIEKDIPVKTSFIKSSEMDANIRSREGLAEKHDKLRVVSIGKWDSTACSGIHVTRTREIGFFKVLDAKSGDERTRIEFAAGLTASSVVSNLYNEVLKRKHSYPYEMEQLGAVLDKAKLAIDDRKMMVNKITQLLTTGPSYEQIDGTRFYHEYLPGFDATTLRILANQFNVSKPSVILLFAPGPKSQVILMVNGMPKESMDYISKTIGQFGGKGGGKGDVFTGGFLDITNPQELYDELVVAVRKEIS
jgi:alanyl-tRNA synthetase